MSCRVMSHESLAFGFLITRIEKIQILKSRSKSKLDSYGQRNVSAYTLFLNLTGNFVTKMYRLMWHRLYKHKC